MTLNERAQVVHQANIKWWQNPENGEPIKRNKYELLALAVSEVAEALEGERKNLQDDHLRDRPMAEVEMADTYIRLLDFSAGFKIEIYEWGPLIATPKNKGQALFEIMKDICKSGGSDARTNISLALARIRAYCFTFGYDLDGAIESKMAFNRTRPDHQHKARRIAGGKQF